MNKINLMAEGGAKLHQIKEDLKKISKPGVRLSEIEAKAQTLIKKAGGKPSFAMVPGYSWATCINLNEGLVHGIPDDKQLKLGDLVSIDVGIFYKGFHTDSCISFIVGNLTDYPKKQEFLETGQQALDLAIKQAKIGNHIGHISKIIQEIIEAKGYNVSRNFTGHGISTVLHEQPMIPCFLEGEIKNTPAITKNQTLAIEVIYMAGNSDTITDKKDNWTVVTKDNQIAGIVEHTIAVTGSDPVILT
ncbi:MAG: type I methionyl aminopeptidase [Candidatus Beckwithbacteria bacterium]|nr:type I methionyl aminopeptidase [Patescibacteria group bacterium]